MLDFKAVRDKTITFAQLVADLTPGDLRDLTNEMVDTMLGMISDCVDADVSFQPLAYHFLGRRIGCLGGRTGAWGRVSRPFPLRNTLGNGDDHGSMSPAFGGESADAAG